MKVQLSKLFVATSLIFAATAMSNDPQNGDLVQVDARYVFVPEGFDDNDESVIVIDGYLPSGCYRLTRPEYQIDPATRKITVAPMARYFDVPCVEAMIPYSVEIKLGILPEGLYDIVLRDQNAAELEVAEATSAGPDDYLYAPVDEASVSQDEDTLALTATISGRFTNSCMEFEEVRLADNGATVNLLPIIKMDDRDDCTEGEFRFKKTVDLPESITNGRHLLHVRSLNGHAINHLFYKSPY